MCDVHLLSVVRLSTGKKTLNELNEMGIRGKWIARVALFFRLSLLVSFIRQIGIYPPTTHLLPPDVPACFSAVFPII